MEAALEQELERLNKKLDEDNASFAHRRNASRRFLTKAHTAVIAAVRPSAYLLPLLSRLCSQLLTPTPLNQTFIALPFYPLVSAALTAADTLVLPTLIVLGGRLERRLDEARRAELLDARAQFEALGFARPKVVSGPVPPPRPASTS